MNIRVGGGTTATMFRKDSDALWEKIITFAELCVKRDRGAI